MSPVAKHRPELLAREKLRYHWPVAVVLVVGLAASFSVFQLASLANVGVGYRDWATLVVGLLAATLLCETVRRTEHLRRSATALSAETSKLKQAAKELETSELRFRLLVEQAPDAILVYDYDLQRFVDANRSAELLFECSKEELLKYGPQHFYTAQQPDAKD